MEFSIEGTQKYEERIRLEVNSEEIIKSLKHKFGFINKDHIYFLDKKEDGLYWGWDASTHGSPWYEYKLMTKDEKLIRVYDAIVELEESINTFLLRS
jgi:hypothetical protein